MKKFNMYNSHEVSFFVEVTISSINLTEGAMKTKIGTEVANVTPDSDTTFKVKRSKVKVTRPLYSSRC